MLQEDRAEPKKFSDEDCTTKCQGTCVEPLARLLELVQKTKKSLNSGVARGDGWYVGMTGLGTRHLCRQPPLSPHEKVCQMEVSVGGGY